MTRKVAVKRAEGRSAPNVGANWGRPSYTTNPRGRPGNLGDPDAERLGCTVVATRGLPTPVLAAPVHPEEEWQETPAGHPHDERQGNAGVTSVGARPHRRGTRRPELVGFWTQRSTADAMSHAPSGWAGSTQRNGSWRATFAPALTGSATAGSWPISRWNGPSSRNGCGPDSWKATSSTRRKQAPPRGTSSCPS